jgi:hypothetical protein
MVPEELGEDRCSGIAFKKVQEEKESEPQEFGVPDGVLKDALDDGRMLEVPGRASAFGR